MPVTLIDWRPLSKGALRGFATVRLDRGLTIFDCPVLAPHNRSWATDAVTFVHGTRSSADGQQ